MASEHSYTITLSNNITEKEAIDLLLSRDSRFWVPENGSRKHILAALGVRPSLSRAFDLVYTDAAQSHPQDGFATAELDAVTLVELKTTRKYLPENPKGFFFGATENEFELARQLGDRFRFCFVCLHERSRGFSMLSLEQVEQLIRTKRTQYQINF